MANVRNEALVIINRQPKQAVLIVNGLRIKGGPAEGLHMQLF